MSDTSSFSSLMALVDHHLSKTSLGEEEAAGPAGAPAALTPLAPPLCPIPSLPSNDNITNALAEQIANMFRAKEKKRREEEERLQLEEEISTKLVIDIMKPSRAPSRPQSRAEHRRSRSSSAESVFEPRFVEFDDEPRARSVSPQPRLLCKTDMSYMLQQRVRRGNCSPFGRVLVSRYRPVAAPYIKERYKTDIKRFDFKSKSPCDIIKNRLKQPCGYNSVAQGLPEFNM